MHNGGSANGALASSSQIYDVPIKPWCTQSASWCTYFFSFIVVVEFLSFFFGRVFLSFACAFFFLSHLRSVRRICEIECSGICRTMDTRTRNMANIMYRMSRHTTRAWLMLGPYAIIPSPSRRSWAESFVLISRMLGVDHARLNTVISLDHHHLRSHVGIRHNTDTECDAALAGYFGVFGGAFGVLLERRYFGCYSIYNTVCIHIFTYVYAVLCVPSFFIYFSHLLSLRLARSPRWKTLLVFEFGLVRSVSV